LVDTLASGASGGNPVEVQVLSSAPLVFCAMRKKSRGSRCHEGGRHCSETKRSEVPRAPRPILLNYNLERLLPENDSYCNAEWSIGSGEIPLTLQYYNLKVPSPLKGRFCRGGKQVARSEDPYPNNPFKAIVSVRSGPVETKSIVTSQADSILSR
jgi:hypothetical protein